MVIHLAIKRALNNKHCHKLTIFDCRKVTYTIAFHKEPHRYFHPSWYQDSYY